MSLKVLTLNLLIDLNQWDLRTSLVLSGIRALDPDIILLQEVSLIPNNAAWLVSHMPGFQSCLVPAGMKTGFEGLAILTSLSVDQHDVLDLGLQDRKAQIIHLHHEGQALAVANTHLYWQEGDAPERLEQAERILAYFETIPNSTLCILGGDFNDIPTSKTIIRVKQHLRSAYESCHGTEPSATFPTPLQRHWRQSASNQADNLINNHETLVNSEHLTTIDYIFASSSLEVLDCQIVLDKPHPYFPAIYPSDHYGLLAVYNIKPI